MDAAEELMLQIAETPRMFPEVTSDHRRGLLRRFPYGVYFLIEASRIVVQAVLHLHRDPGVLRTRLSR